MIHSSLGPPTLRLPHLTPNPSLLPSLPSALTPVPPPSFCFTLCRLLSTYRLFTMASSVPTAKYRLLPPKPLIRNHHFLSATPPYLPSVTPPAHGQRTSASHIPPPTSHLHHHTHGSSRRTNTTLVTILPLKHVAS